MTHVFVRQSQENPFVGKHSEIFPTRYLVTEIFGQFAHRP